MTKRKRIAAIILMMVTSCLGGMVLGLLVLSEKVETASVIRAFSGYCAKIVCTTMHWQSELGILVTIAFVFLISIALVAVVEILSVTVWRSRKRKPEARVDS